jgi:hypothetical protein
MNIYIFIFILISAPKIDLKINVFIYYNKMPYWLQNNTEKTIEIIQLFYDN